MHYLFRGLRRGVADRVSGRITAPNEDIARAVLDRHDIVVDSLGPESPPPGQAASTGRPPLFAQALEDALEEAGLRVRFDQMARRHEGHGVWVLDQGKVHRRLMQLVGEMIGDDDHGRQARHRIARVLEALAAAVEPPAATAVAALDLQAEISRLAAAVGKMERAVASGSLPARGDRPQRQVVPKGAAHDRTQDDVLTEIFESNLELVRVIEQEIAGAGTRG